VGYFMCDSRIHTQRCIRVSDITAWIDIWAKDDFRNVFIVLISHQKSSVLALAILDVY